ncbi:ArsR family transcriptional regulator [Alkalibaculum sp. M08DMB]|uniref:ArsR family transcriptional regulator n=1 Tax=Alkalibaculum sporogenes TaxID=2655001 RepID=A0A6A7K785_9FIRM|nr:winged helix-turn-helix domain-containing protein [Alkalibaculum sporogenes]MPW25245.1 ArsR family transcriptional regulator [Alkalibaculum sporogenes]
MSHRIFTELDPFIETLGLLIHSHNLDETRTSIIKELDNLGFIGTDLYSKHFKIFDKYISTFKKYSVVGAEDKFFFEDIESNHINIITMLMISNKDFVDKIDEISSQKINHDIIEYIVESMEISLPDKEIENLEDIISFLDSNNSLGFNDKWKIMKMLQNSKYYLKKLISIINNNIDAYAQAHKSISKQLEKLINQYNETVTLNGTGLFNEMLKSLTDNIDIYPTLAFPALLIAFEKSCYYGLLSPLVIRGEKNSKLTQEDFLYCLKTLSDKSKMEIIKTLKVSPKYNLEIANEIGLTAATVSYHMAVLLTCGFVSVEKQDGRVYYNLKKDTIKDFIDLMEETLI